MRNELSHTVCIHVIGFIMCGSYKIAIHTVLLSAVDGEILGLLHCTFSSCPQCLKYANIVAYTIYGAL